ncbi:MAG: hypothetical protein LBM08_13580 [Dysgonamonadaceae bacterium]|jgi:hypothetical protein|nr:hypothetical protein [Dysgonamonadaceae bacterium]
MRANLNISFAYHEQAKNEIEKETADVLLGLAEFCDDTDFEFQCLPRIGESIVVEPLIRKWLENKKYKKPCPDGKVFGKIYPALKTGALKVDDIQHELDVCTIFCSDIEYEEIE